LTVYDGFRITREKVAMKTHRKRLLIAVLSLAVICCSFGAWGVIRVVAWARDLPNRIVIDVDGIADSFGAAVVQSYHEALLKGDPPTQRQVIRDFSGLVVENAAAQEWVRTEYSDDLRRLASSPDADVAADAAKLLAELVESRDDAQAQSADSNRG
jgi:hypothetical protein